MKYKKLGNTGLRVSRICLGTMDIGGRINETEGIGLIKNALDLGINFLDTGDAYPVTSRGKSEEIIGKAIKENRHSVVVATKVQPPTGPGINDKGLSRKHIMRAVEDSLKRLQTDYIDVYYLHNPDPVTPILETLQALNDLVRHGKVLYIGCSNYTVWEIGKVLGLSALYNLARFVSVEPPYNLLCRDVEVEMLPLCENEGLGACVYSPMASELLSGMHEFGKPPKEGGFTGSAFGEYSKSVYWSEINFKAVDQLKKVAAQCNLSMPQFSLAWVLSNDTITSAISGAATIEQLKENVSSVDVKLPPDALQACDEVWSMFRPQRHHYARDGKLRKI